MSSSSGSNRQDIQRRKARSLLLVLAVGFAVFLAAGGALYYVLQPTTLRVAVGPTGSEDHAVIEAMAEAFADESRTVMLSPVTTAGAAKSLALLGNGKAELAVGRADLSMPSDAQTLAVLRKNYVVLWSFSGPGGKVAKKKNATKIAEIADLAGRKVGVIGRTAANASVLRVILDGSGVEPDKVGVAQFSTDEIEKLAQDRTIEAYLAVGPLDSKITADAIAATARTRGTPKFLPIDASEAIALKHSRYEAEEIPPSVFNAKPAWPEEKVDTIAVSHLILGQKRAFRSQGGGLLSAAFRGPGYHHPACRRRRPYHQAGDREGGRAVRAPRRRRRHQRHGTDIPGQVQRLHLVRLVAAVRHWFGRCMAASLSQPGRTGRKHRPSQPDPCRGFRIRAVQSDSEFAATQREVDAIIKEALTCFDEGAIEQEDLAAFALALELFDHAVAERRAELQAGLMDPARAPTGAPTLASRR